MGERGEVGKGITRREFIVGAVAGGIVLGTRGLLRREEVRVTANWGQFRNGVGRRGVTGVETLLTPANIAGLHIKWQQMMAPGDGATGNPIVMGGKVYCGAEDGVFRQFDAITGEPGWAVSLGGPIKSGAAIVGGVIYVGCDDWNVYAIDASTGAVVWKYMTGGAVSGAVLVYSGTVYACSYDGYTYALDTAGNLRWRTVAKLWRNYRGPCLDASLGLLYFSNQKPLLTAVNVIDGSQVWSAPLVGKSLCNPCVFGGVVYVGDDGGVLHAFDAATGAVVWETPPLDTNFYNANPSDAASTPSLIRGCPAVDKNMVFVTTNEGVDGQVGTAEPKGHTWAFKTSNGSLVWAKTQPDMSGFAPTIFDGMVYSSGYGSGWSGVYDELSGSLLWKSGYKPNPFNGAFHGGAAVVNGLIYVQCDNGNLYCLGV
jgi:outer membrane protein assembly factor BamB